MREGKEISLVGFGHFTINKVAAKIGLNPKTRESVNVPAYNQAKFKAGQKLKDAVNAK
jgi:DNA-binding protein HU-beta